jgi:hypothetical protein
LKRLVLCWTLTTVPTAKVGIFAVADGAEELGKVAVMGIGVESGSAASMQAA